MDAARPSRGSPPRRTGELQQFTVRIPLEQFEVYKREAVAHGLPVAHYLAAALARGHGLPEPDYVRPDRPDADAMLAIHGTR